MILNSQQIAQMAYNAGFRGEALNVAVAVALAESGGDSNAYNPELAAGTPPGSGSRGLWQIYGGAHPQYNNDSMFNPQANALAAFAVYRQAGNRFTPWSTYNLGWAKPKQNYAAMIGGINNILTTITGNKPNTQQVPPPGNAEKLNSQMGGGAQGGTTQKLTGIDWLRNQAQTPGEPDTGPKSINDWMFLGLGASLILIGLIFLFATGFKGLKMEAQ